MIPEIKKILYATDLSENSRLAFSYAASIANRFGAGVTILYVMEALSSNAAAQITAYIGDEEWAAIKKRNQQEVIETLKTRLEAFCAEAGGELPECPFITEKTLVEVGHPSTVILEHAHKDDFDLVVMGTHGHSALVDVMMGGTARRVLRRCKKPVLTVRLPKE
ncbi:MAG: universal stress protein [Desulfobacterales bacterium]|nr:universal stress protein [Desulfobacterales bacterium]